MSFSSFNVAMAPSELSSPSPVRREIEGDTFEDFKFKQVFLTGKDKKLVIPLTVKDPADGQVANDARKKLLEKLAAGTKTISYVDIKNLTMTVRTADGKLATEAIELDEHVKTLRAVYGRLAKANEIPVSWDAQVTRSLATPSRRIAAMNLWPRDEMIGRLGIRDRGEQKRAVAIEELHSRMKAAIQSNEAGIQPDVLEGRKELENLFEGCRRLALIAAAGRVTKERLEAAVRSESGEKEQGLVRGTILGFTEDELTSAEKAYLEDILLLDKKGRGEWVAAYHELGRTAPQESFDRALLAAFNTVAERGADGIDDAVNTLLGHPRIAAIGLSGAELDRVKTQFKAMLALVPAELA